jgi:5-methylcytosine-specific restriction endonuclease McrA
MKYPVLVLNVNFLPVGILRWERGMVLSLCNKDSVDVIKYYDKKIKDTKGYEYPIPAVIKTNKYVKISFSRVRLNNHNLFARDKYTCQYCGKKFRSDDLTCDHVIPKSKWKGRHNNHCWTNVVTACFKCNNKKADKILDQSGMKLLKKPTAPKMIDIVAFHNNRQIPPAWEDFLV